MSHTDQARGTTIAELVTSPSRWPYVEQRTRKGERVYAPYVFAEIHVDARCVARGQFLLDTGADRTHFPADCFAFVDGGQEACERLSMIWGEDWRTDVFAPPGEWRAHVGGFLAPLRPVIGSDFGSAVLGRDFMESFRATFDGRAREAILDPYPEAS
jgi:hypothetical protein